jgi:glycosyl transferase family 25
LKALLISLQTATERRAFQTAQAQARGLVLEVVPAVTPADLSQGDDLTWDGWHRPLMPTEKACFLSHRAAWQRVQALGEPCLILEDDALLSRNLPGYLKAISQVAGLDHVSLEVRLRKKLLGPLRHLVGGLGWAPLYQDRTGAAAYVLWPQGAQALLQQAKQEGPALADAFINDSRALRSAQAVPALAIQADVAHDYGVASALVTTSYIQAQGAKQGHAATGWSAWAYKRRRLGGQWALAVRFLAHMHHARRQSVALDLSGFDSVG